MSNDVGVAFEQMQKAIDHVHDTYNEYEATLQPRIEWFIKLIHVFLSFAMAIAVFFYFYFRIRGTEISILLPLMAGGVCGVITYFWGKINVSIFLAKKIFKYVPFIWKSARARELEKKIKRDTKVIIKLAKKLSKNDLELFINCEKSEEIRMALNAARDINLTTEI